MHLLYDNVHGRTELQQRSKLMYGTGVGIAVGVVVALVLVGIFLFYGFPVLRERGESGEVYIPNGAQFEVGTEK